MLENFPTRLKKVREALGMSQESLGERLGVAGNYVYMLEKGERNPSRKLESKFRELEQTIPASNKSAPRATPRVESLERSRQDIAPAVEISVAQLAHIMETQTKILERMLATMERLESKELAKEPGKQKRPA
jgi:transcriptional regulator with XRE-family HTH domain